MHLISWLISPFLPHLDAILNFLKRRLPHFKKKDTLSKISFLHTNFTTKLVAVVKEVLFLVFALCPVDYSTLLLTQE